MELASYFRVWKKSSLLNEIIEERHLYEQGQYHLLDRRSRQQPRPSHPVLFRRAWDTGNQAVNAGNGIWTVPSRERKCFWLPMQNGGQPALRAWPAGLPERRGQAGRCDSSRPERRRKSSQRETPYRTVRLSSGYS